MRIRTRALASEPDDAVAERTARRGLAESLDEGHAEHAATTTCMATRGSACWSETRQTTWSRSRPVVSACEAARSHHSLKRVLHPCTHRLNHSAEHAHGHNQGTLLAHTLLATHVRLYDTQSMRADRALRAHTSPHTHCLLLCTQRTPSTRRPHIYASPRSHAMRVPLAQCAHTRSAPMHAARDAL